jgi:dTDP-4-dehydrorhamnose 3,5-epimerase
MHDHRPTRAPATVTAAGERLQPGVDGVSLRRAITHQDDRGTLCEIYTRGIDAMPMVHAYAVTVRPGKVKGWACHESQVDRYFFMSGSVKLVLYDGREGSPTFGLVAEHYFSEVNRSLVSVPPGVYHAIENLGDTEALLFNIPSEVYRHDAPDKLTLPLENALIPYSFTPRRGG